MSCPDPVELSRALLVGIDDRLRAHLAICTQCAADIEAHAAIADKTRQLPLVDPTPDHARSVRTKLMAAARAPAPITRPRFVGGFALAGALAAAAVLVFVIATPKPPPQATTAYRGTVHPHPGAGFVRIGSAPDEIIRLTHGTLTVEVAELAPGERVRVVTGDGELDVRDTVFDVTVDRDHLRAVRVLQGQVIVRAHGAAATSVSAGERWETQLAAAEPAPTAVVEAPVVAEPPPHDNPRHDVTVASPQAPPPPPPSPDLTGTAPSSRQTSSASTIAPSSRRTSSASSIATSPAPSSRRTSSPSATATSPAPSSRTSSLSSTATSPTSSPARPKRPIEALFEEGWATLASGDPGAAAAIFERAAKSAPNDPLAEDAWFWRASALAKAKSPSAATALESFLSRYPRSPRVGEASAMLGWLVIDADLERAERLFRAAEQDRVGAVRASATKGLAAIAQRRSRGN